MHGSVYKNRIRWHSFQINITNSSVLLLFHGFYMIYINARNKNTNLTMALQGNTILFSLLLVLGCAVTSSRAINQSHFGTTCDTGVLKRSSFPAGFIFGAASAAYQVVLDFGFFAKVMVR